MRMAFGMAALVTCLAAQPATAREEPAFRGDAPAPTAALPNTLGTPIGSDFRLRATLAGTVQPSDLGADPEGHLRRRIASSMFDLYPVDGSGFHLSAGMRLFARRNFMSEMEKFTRGLLYSPRGLGDGTIRNGFKRYTPAMTVGYTRMIQRDLSVGLEAGSLLGRAYTGVPGRLRDSAFGGQTGGTMNPIVNLVMGARF